MHLSLTFAVLLLLAHLNLLIASPAMPDHLIQCSRISDWHLANVIVEHFDEKTARHFHMTCSAINGACKLSREARRIKYLEAGKKSYVGDNPSFLQSVRQCMHSDDVICFKYVTGYFKNLTKGEPHKLELVQAQLPHLAAKLNAPNIFKALNISNSTQEYRQVLIRAYFQRSEKFFSEIGGIRPMDGPEWPVNGFDFYNQALPFLERENANFVSSIDGDLLYYRYQHNQYLFETGSFYAQHRNQHPEDFVFITEQRTSCPSITDILAALNTPDLEERRANINELKTRIDNVLQQGVYIMDDIVLNIRNTVYLWWKYAQPLKSALCHENGAKVNDGGASEFVYWLIDQGAPMDEKHLLKSSSFNSYDQSRFRELVRVWSLYSGGPTKSLIGFLHDTYEYQYAPTACGEIRKSLPLFNAIGADVFDTSVLWYIALWVTETEYKKGSKECHRDIMVWYVKNGLKKDNLNVLQGQIPSWFTKKRRNSVERIQKVVSRWRELIGVSTPPYSEQPTISLIRFLHHPSYVRYEICPQVRQSLPQYKAKGADIFDTRVLWLIAFWLTNFNKTEDCHRDIMVWYAANGLERNTLDALLKKPIPTWLPAHWLEDYEALIHETVREMKLEIVKQPRLFSWRFFQ